MPEGRGSINEMLQGWWPVLAFLVVGTVDTALNRSNLEDLKEQNQVMVAKQDALLQAVHGIDTKTAVLQVVTDQLHTRITTNEGDIKEIYARLGEETKDGT